MRTRAFRAVIALWMVGALGCADDAPAGRANNSVANNTPNNSAVTGETPVCDGTSCTCPTEGKVLCGGDLCVDLSADPDHCGRCGEDCNTGESCQSGVCVCGAGALQCGDNCVDASSDFEHCGQCGNRCQLGETCNSGVCEPLSCDGSEVACRTGCTDLSSDEANCGRCGEGCFINETCVSGVCTCPADDPVCNQVSNVGTLVGGACDQNTDCIEQCLQGGDFPSGTCSTGCASDADCPQGTSCTDAEGGTCLLNCREDNECRNGYECRDRNRTGHPGEARVCIAD